MNRGFKRMFSTESKCPFFSAITHPSSNVVISDMMALKWVNMNQWELPQRSHRAALYGYLKSSNNKNNTRFYIPVPQAHAVSEYELQERLDSCGESIYTEASTAALTQCSLFNWRPGPDLWRITSVLRGSGLVLVSPVWSTAQLWARTLNELIVALQWETFFYYKLATAWVNRGVRFLQENGE